MGVPLASRRIPSRFPREAGTGGIAEASSAAMTSPRYALFMRRVLLLLFTLPLLSIACGSGGEQPSATETSDRAPREASVVQQDTAADAQAAQDQQSPSTDQPVGPQQQADGDSATALPSQAVGVHKGVRSQGTSLGLAEAPVLIEHFGDFT